jgi:hypothetical protein
VKAIGDAEPRVCFRDIFDDQKPWAEGITGVEFAIQGTGIGFRVMRDHADPHE